MAENLQTNLLVITLGDPLSINIAALQRVLPQHPVFPILIIGNPEVWKEQLSDEFCWLNSMKTIQQFPKSTFHGYLFLARGKLAAKAVSADLSPRERGNLAWAALEAVGELPSFWQRIAVFTCPINKQNCRIAGFRFPGQTEFFENLWQEEGIMIMMGGSLVIGLASNHVPLRQVVSQLTTKQIYTKGIALVKTLCKLTGNKNPKIGVCGINPHAGEGGLCGLEEETVLRPAIRLLNQQECGEFIGPIPADTAFYRCVKGEFVGILAMYHDQALAPIKTLYFEEAINVTGGLAHFRCSPDHGPAEDRFFTQDFSIKSFANAFQACINYLHGKKSSLLT